MRLCVLGDSETEDFFLGNRGVVLMVAANAGISRMKETATTTRARKVRVMGSIGASDTPPACDKAILFFSGVLAIVRELLQLCNVNPLRAVADAPA